MNLMFRRLSLKAKIDTLAKLEIKRDIISSPCCLGPSSAFVYICKTILFLIPHLIIFFEDVHLPKWRNDGTTNWRRACPNCCTYPKEAVHTTVSRYHRDLGMQPNCKKSTKRSLNRQSHTHCHLQQDASRCWWCSGKNNCLA